MSLSIALALAMLAAESASTVPPQFVGTWEPGLEHCGGNRSDYVIQLEPNRITFWESSGPLTSIVVRGEREIAVIAELSDEGTTWLSTEVFQLSPEGDKLIQATDSGEGRVRYRCPQASAPVAGPDSTRFEDLPPAVQARILELFHGERPANADGDYNATDLLATKLPMRRLAFWHRRGHDYFIHYEHGGRGWHAHVIGIRLRGGDAEPIFNVTFPRTFDSLDALEKGLSAMEFGAGGDY